MQDLGIEAVVFDLGGVIVGHDDAAMIDALTARCAAPWTASDVARLAGAPRWATGAPVRELHDLLRADAGYAGDWPRFVEDWCSHLKLDPAMLDFVEALAARGRVMIFSNTNAEHWSFFLEVSGRRLAHLEAHLSHEIGHLKPDARAYRAVVARAGTAPGKLLFFDDKIANVAAARREGFQAEVFTGLDALRGMLAARGLYGP